MTPGKVKRTLKSLIAEGEALLKTATTRYPGMTNTPVYEVDVQLSAKWAVNVMAFLRSVFGEDSHHHASAGQFAAYCHITSNAERMLGVVKAALVAWNSGYATSMRNEIAVEIELSLIDQARDMLTRKYWHGAASVAGAVLERHLRALCLKYKRPLIDGKGKQKTLNPLNDDLRSEKVYDLPTHTLITSLVQIRNLAAHGNSANATDSALIVRETERLVKELV